MKKIVLFLFLVMITTFVSAIKFDGVYYSSLEEAENAISASKQQEGKDAKGNIDISDIKPKRISKKLQKAIEFYIEKIETFLGILNKFQSNIDATPINIEEKNNLLNSINETINYLDDLNYNLMATDNSQKFNALVRNINKELLEYKANMSDLYVEYTIKLSNNSIEKIETSVNIANKPIQILKKSCPKYLNNLKKIDTYNQKINTILDKARLELKNETYNLAKRDISKAQASVRLVNKGLMKVYEKCGLGKK